jgi:hypothetical protein
MLELLSKDEFCTKARINRNKKYTMKIFMVGKIYHLKRAERLILKSGCGSNQWEDITDTLNGRLRPATP